ncbi:MAG: HAD family hydrolase [Albidovulum sp.]|jgi:HAD superfamily hydrolase (TIGR01509 family)
MLVIFDCDGVLVDSEPISIAVLRGVLAGSGVAMTEGEAYDRFLGKSMATIAEMLHAEFGLVFTDAHLEQVRAELFHRFEAELTPIPGIGETLKRLDAACCVASSSQPDRIRLSLRVTGLLEVLEPHIYSATMVKRGKPFPDLFLHAARDMGHAPEDCIVIEDSPAGIAAARSAGMRVFAFTGGLHAARPGFRDDLAALGPDLIFDDMRRLPGLLAGHGAQENP